jgi:TetR/AcrR family transcriptional repressor of nem operon
MRVSRQQAAENRERIVDMASQLFRERGFDGVGVADLMKSASLTHGGFYGHFESKEDLMAEAALRAQENAIKKWTKVIDEAPGDPLQAVVTRYLSTRHRDEVSKGCLLAALGPEVTRHGTSLRHTVTEGLRPFIDLFARIVPGHSKAARRKKAIALYASLIGGVILARAVDDSSLSNEILHAVAASLPKGEKQPANKIEHQLEPGS